MSTSDEEFVNAVNTTKRLRARFDQRKGLKHQFELLIRFDQETYGLWGLYQQAVVGNINVPKLDYMDPAEESWMWSWIKGNEKWHAWNKCKGMTKNEALQAYIEGVRSLEKRLPDLVEDWKDDQDPRIPDRNRYVPDDEREEYDRLTREGKLARRQRNAEQRAKEEALGWWDE
uniref:ACB domain-containing protein n=1 Tax=Haemonchus contortus TaxID=6289 RepID=A0A7I4Y4T0_HAECO